jgi:hypothetical protein
MPWPVPSFTINEWAPGKFRHIDRPKPVASEAGFESLVD